MKSTYGYLDVVSTYVERIAYAKDEGKWVASHGTQQPLEILEAMDVRGVFNEFWGVVSDIVRLESVPEALSVSASTGTPRGGLLLLPEHGRPDARRQVAPLGHVPLRRLVSATTSSRSTRWAGATESRASAWSGPSCRTRLMRSSSGRTSTSA